MAITGTVSRFAELRTLCEDKPHGTRAHYVTGCHCPDCRRANNEYQKHRNKKRQQGDWNGIVDAFEVRTHLSWLSRHGVGRRSVHAATDVPESTLVKIITGERRNIRARTARKILAVGLESRADKTVIDGRRQLKLLHELVARGFTKAFLAKQLGYAVPALQFKRKMTVRSAHRNRAPVSRDRGRESRAMKTLLAIPAARSTPPLPNQRTASGRERHQQQERKL